MEELAILFIILPFPNFLQRFACLLLLLSSARFLLVVHLFSGRIAEQQAFASFAVSPPPPSLWGSFPLSPLAFDCLFARHDYRGLSGGEL